MPIQLPSSVARPLHLRSFVRTCAIGASAGALATTATDIGAAMHRTAHMLFSTTSGSSTEGNREMTAGFNLELSAAQADMKDKLHLAAQQELRTNAARSETEGPDLNLLARLLTEAGVAPSAWVENGSNDPHTLLVAVEELAYGDAALAWAAVPALQTATVVGLCGTDAQRAAVSAAFAREGTRVSVLLYEDFGRQPSEYETRVTTGGGQIVIDGRKSSVAHPGSADVSLVVGCQGADLSAFCFTSPTDAVTAEGSDHELGRIAFSALPSGPVRINGLTGGPAEQLGDGIALHRAVGQARLLLAACLIGVARASLEFASAYATKRTTWGQPIAEYQGVSFPLIEQTTELLEVRLLLWGVAERLQKIDTVEDIEQNVARVVNRASSLGLRATRNGVQLVGVRGISRDLPCERWYREAAALAAIDFDILQTPFGLN
jgi:alkylation response protein AidB-like acyl-CoA dehydrogenase